MDVHKQFIEDIFKSLTSYWYSFGQLKYLEFALNINDTFKDFSKCLQIFRNIENILDDILQGLSISRISLRISLNIAENHQSSMISLRTSWNSFRYPYTFKWSWRIPSNMFETSWSIEDVLNDTTRYHVLLVIFQR